MVKTSLIVLLLIGLIGATASGATLRSPNNTYLNGAEGDVPTIVTAPRAIVNEGFESATFPPTGWSLSGAAAIWSRSTDCSGYGVGVASTRADFYNVNGGTQDLVTYVCSPTGATDTLVFDHAYAPYPGTYLDSLTIWTSTDGGSNWTKLIGLVGGASGTLNTAPATTSQFIPTAGQWATKKYALVANTNRIRFRGHSAYGNELYLDNIKVIYPSTDHDAMIAQIISPAGQVTAPINPRLLVRNNGLNAESFQVNCLITHSAATVYSESLTVANLAAGDTQTVSFPLWMPVYCESYGVQGWTSLAGDLTPGNDTMTSSFNTNTYQRKVFGVDFTATWCTWCPWHQVAWDWLKEEAGDTLCMIAMHSSASSDSFYFAALGTLATYYGVPGYPTSHIDGIVSFVGSDTSGAGVGQYNAFRAVFDQRKVINSPFGIVLSGTYSGGNGTITATIDYPGTTPLPITIRGAAVEASKYSVWPSPTHQLRQDSVRSLARSIFPSAAGDTFTLATGATVKNYPITINAGWNTSKLSFVVWAEKRGLKENYQADEILYSELTGIAGEPTQTVGVRTALLPVGPNPSAGKLRLSYDLAAAGRVTLGVYDVAGRLVATVADGTMPAGSHSVSWNGTDRGGRKVASGVYFVRLDAGGASQTQRITVVR
ncbi:MAG: T9SS type A sorting domain-containing protein [Candidatus Edwardsbacteria bacterium]|jgi:hypothetical protein|nr:T9SS type A sorting domain-containing protein [Candidatus Edwardsbacteria bacterium]